MSLHLCIYCGIQIQEKNKFKYLQSASFFFFASIMRFITVWLHPLFLLLYLYFTPTSFCFISSLIYYRLFGGKPNKQAPVTTAENMKNSTVISNPHATMNHVATVLESPDTGLGGGDSETSSPLFGGRALGSGMGTLGSEQVSRKCWRQ